MMKLTVNIESDEQLRKAVQDMIKGQVKSIVRDDFHQMVKDELARKIKGTNEYEWKNLMKEALQVSMKQALYKEHDIGQFMSEWIEPIIGNIVQKSIKGINWDDRVNTMANRKIKEMLEKT